MDRRKRIAIYGGTFDPVHNGHVEVARNTVELFEISKLFFVPARKAPHKLELEVTDPLHRYAMLALATQDDARLLISTFELQSADRGYTVDTLSHFGSEVQSPSDLFFIMGADSWAEVMTWRDWKRLFQLANLVVVTRPGFEVKLQQEALAAVAEIHDVRSQDAERISQLLDETSGPRVYITDAAMVDVSATTIRDAARQGCIEELRKLLPVPVADYITKYKLYKNSHEN
jgi:nicotinate-nucleotide adenylyltransferase